VRSIRENRKMTRKEALKRSINRRHESIKIYNNEIQYEYVEWIKLA
jgi:hypothetical protein